MATRIEDEVKLKMLNGNDETEDGKGNDEGGFHEVHVDDNQASGDVDGQSTEPGQNKPRGEIEPRKLVFNDGKKKIDFILAWSIKCNQKKTEEAQKARSIFEKNLRKEGLEIEYDTKGVEIHYAKIHASYNVLIRYADILAIRMPMKESLVLQNIKDKYNELEGYQNLSFGRKEQSLPVGYEHPGTSVVISIWNKVSAIGQTLLGPFQLDKDAVPKIKRTYTCPYSTDKNYLFETDGNDELEFSNAQRSRVVDYILRRKAFKEDTKKAFSFGVKKMINDEYYSAVYPLHEGHWKKGSAMNARKRLYDYWAHWKNILKFQPLNHIRQYFGEKIGMYFAWLGFYTTMLVPAAIVGFIVFVYGLFIMNASSSSKEMCDPANNITMCPLCDKQCPYWKIHDGCSHQSASRIFDNDATVFFAVFMSLWGTLFLEFWKRKEATIQYKWDLSNFVSEEEPPRPEYLTRLESWTTLKVNPVTGMKEPYLPFWRRRFPVFLCSYGVMIFLAAVAIGAVIGVIAYRVSMLAALHILQEQVIVSNSSDAAVTTVKLVYQNAGLITTITAALINLVIILILNIVYGYLAFWLTDWECLRTQSEYDNSITLKLFALQFVNYFASIVYVAFFKGRFTGRPGDYNTIFGNRQEECEPGGCLIELCIQLAIIMVGKQLIQNNFIEIVVPKIIKMIKKKISKETRAQKLARTPWEKDYKLGSAENTSLFYEYLEMVLQFGFLTIFCSAFPLAPLFALLNNVIEIRVDANKLITGLRRPMAERAADIGIWYSVLYGISRIAVISNAFIISLTSDFIPRLVYKMAYSPTHKSAGYLNHSLSIFNTSDFSINHRPDPMFGHVEECRYRDFRNPPGHENEYALSDKFWHVLAARLAFVVVFENVVIVVTSLIAWMIPDVPTMLKEQIRREAYITNEVVLKTELLRARGETIDTEKMEVISDEEANSYETSNMSPRRRDFADI